MRVCVYVYVCVCGTDRESVDYITNPTDLMNLGRDTGRLDGEVSGTKIRERKRKGSDDDSDDDTDDENGGDKEGQGQGDDDAGDDAMKGKKMRMSLQKGEVHTYTPYLLLMPLSTLLDQSSV